ncbi:PAS domain S-box protein [Mangrovibacterium diazotrophicum]|uniref:Sensory/regulatory protein RpfC n=1 Tax=Mangrovibacterium diazotrophicum TaxID=1261403 RepID=A0A419W332_9BACT|nr:PAS domain S-box protein [Mangrovibacterium diazotrophicum]RKD89891.1 PAS domain S-box-containing protein [Mangrovibacterium diazotrophicum]
MITELILNSTLLITLTVLFSFISRHKNSGKLRHQVLSGLLFGSITVIGMYFPLKVSSGIIYDGRSIVLSMAGLFGGHIAGLISMVMALAYRGYVGGDGLWAGMASIIVSVAWGFVFRWAYNGKPENIRALTFYLFGLTTNVSMLACQLLLPKAVAWHVIENIWLPVLLIFPAACMFMGMIFRNEAQRVNAEDELEENEYRHRTTLLSIGDGLITTDNKGLVTFINPKACELTGWPEAECVGTSAEEIFKVLDPETGDPLICPIQKVLVSGEAIEHSKNKLLQTKNGRKIPITNNSSLIKDTNGKVTGVVLVFKDQSREQSLQRKLVDSERLFHTLTEKSPVGIFRTRGDGYTTYVNPKWLEISGLSFEQALGDGWLSAVHPEDRKAIADNWEIASKNKVLSETEYRFVKPDGTINWVLGVAVPEYDPNKKLFGYIGTVININERKRAENELIQSHENFRRTMDDSPLGMRIVSNSGKTLYTNAAFLNLYGYRNLDEFHKTPSSQRYSEESFKEHERRKANRKKGLPEEPDYETEIITKSGKIKNLIVKRKTIFWDSEMLNLVIYQDFTDRKQAERRLQLFGKATDQSPVSIIITDDVGKIIYANPKFTEVSGYSLDEVIGENPSFLKSGVHSNEFYKKLWETILKGEEWQGEFLNRRKNGDLFWESALISSIVDEKGKITHLVAVKEDITEKKKIISDLQAAKEKAEESDRLKSAFLANMSHEIRTPLNTIMGFSNLLVDDEDLSQEEKKEFASILNQSSENLLQLINDILDISKIETGQLKINQELFDCCPIVQDQLLITQQQLQKQNKNAIKLVQSCDNKSAEIYADKIRFTQILSNLLSNAVKFTDRGEIRFGIENSDASQVTFFVSDTGIGISPDKQQNIFERFRQEDDSSTRAYGGAGLGLAISKKLAEQMGGKITLDSTLGKGSTFRFTMPKS